MPAKVHADVLSSFLNFQATYQEPIFDFLKLYGQLAQAVYRAFREWNVRLENVSSKQNPVNFADASTTFALPGGRIAFTIGLGACNLVVANPLWSEAETLAKILEQGVAALQGAAGVVIAHQRATLGMHLKPVSGSIKDVVLNTLALKGDVLKEDARAYGVSVYREDSSWVVDASAVYPDALFVRIDRTWGPGVALGATAKQLKADQTHLLDLLCLEVD